MASQRIEYLDAVKGFAIFLVVVGHAILWNAPDWELNIQFDAHNPSALYRGIIFQWIYSFHMPLFFMISGFFLKSIDAGMVGLQKRSHLKQTIISKSQRLLVPYFVTGFFWMIVRQGFGYWFLFGLWEISILAMLMIYIMSYINKQNSIWIDLIGWGVFFLAVKILLPALPKNNIVEFDRCLFDVPAFIAGILIRKYDLFRHLNLKVVCLLLIVFIVSFALSYIPYIYPERMIAIKSSEYLRNYMIPLAGCGAIIGLFKLYSKSSFMKLFVILGMFSLEIYILHIFFLVQNPKIGTYIFNLPPHWGFAAQLILSVFLSIIAVAASVGLGKLLHRNKTLSFVLFGIKYNV